MRSAIKVGALLAVIIVKVVAVIFFASVALLALLCGFWLVLDIMLEWVVMTQKAIDTVAAGR